MEIDINPGKYIVAVSGGVDSVALLHGLVTTFNSPEYKFSVAHLDHGMRADSAEDKKLVQALAQKYGLPFVYEAAQLGTGASEEKARNARYIFLRQVKKAANARAIITAHHADDTVETAIFNLLRGTGRKGLSPLSSGQDIVRPLLHLSKRDIYNYAQQHNLTWREDSSNRDVRFARNHIRHIIIPMLSDVQLRKFRQHIDRAHELNLEIDALLVNALHLRPAHHVLERESFAALPHRVAKEVLAEWLRLNGVRAFDNKTIERLTVVLKAAPSNTEHAVIGDFRINLKPAGTADLVLNGKKSPKKTIFQV